jgi:hypothetical protein
MRFQIPDDGDAFMKIICVLEAGEKQVGIQKLGS